MSTSEVQFFKVVRLEWHALAAVLASGMSAILRSTPLIGRGSAGWIAMLALLVGSGVAQADAVAGVRSDDFTIHDLQGAARNLSELRGKPVLINYWASWCGPCVKELPELDHFWQGRARHGVQVLGIANDEQAAVQAFLRQVPVSFPIWVEPLPASGQGSASLFQQTGGALPFSVLLDARGRVVRSKLGAITADELADWADALSSENHVTTVQAAGR